MLAVVRTKSLCAVALLLCLVAGCDSGDRSGKPSDAAGSAVTSPDTAGSAVGEATSPDASDPMGQQSPSAAGDELQPASTADSDVAAPTGENTGEPQNPLIRGMMEVIGSNRVFGTDDAKDVKSSLENQLLEADQLITKAKVQGRAAIRNANRQQRVNEQRMTNLLVLIADDLGVGDLGCYGQKLIDTPNINRMASEGVRFSDFYTSSPDESVAQWSLMSGRIGQAAEHRRGENFGLRDADWTLAEVLWQANYDTLFIGQWKLGTAAVTSLPHRHGFEEWLGVFTGAAPDDAFPDFVWNNEVQLRLPPNAGGKKHYLADDIYTQEVIAYLKHHKSSRPFFALVHLSLPADALEIPLKKGENAADWTDKQLQYAHAVKRLDENVGRILDTLKELEADANTAVFFMSDNGPSAENEELTEFFRSTGDYRGAKESVYEGGLRTPLVVRWPADLPAGTVVEQPCSIVDLNPTLLEIAGAFQKPSNLDGESLVEAMKGKPTVDAQTRLLYWISKRDGVRQAARVGDWKAVSPSAGKPLELYNLREDPGETKDLAKQHPEKLKQFIRPEPKNADKSSES